MVQKKGVTKKKVGTKRRSLDNLTPKAVKEMQTYTKTYDIFLKNARVPYDAVVFIESILKKQKITEWKPTTKAVPQGTHYIKNDDNTNIAIIKFGTENIENGTNVIGAHLDSPCLHGKVHPVLEKPEGVVLDCYPYGGIYEHQWTDAPVTVIGHCFKNGKVIRFELNGMITDVTIHLSRKKRYADSYEQAFPAESLDVFVGYKDKAAFYADMKKKYGIEKEDFATTHLIAVPAQEPFLLSDLYYAGFGQDDKVCSYAQLEAIISAKVKKTAIALFFDREEIGSTGYNGAVSKFLETVYDCVLQSYKKNISDIELRRIFANSSMISADVDVALSANDMPFSEKENSVSFGDGISLLRFNGGAYQSAGNNVSLKVLDKYVQLFKKYDIVNEVTAIPSKANTGGGGTIAMYFTHRGIPTIDMGIAVTNMHGKYSVIFLPDLYQMIKGFETFYSNF